MCPGQTYRGGDDWEREAHLAGILSSMEQRFQRVSSESVEVSAKQLQVGLSNDFDSPHQKLKVKRYSGISGDVRRALMQSVGLYMTRMLCSIYRS